MRRVDLIGLEPLSQAHVSRSAWLDAKRVELAARRFRDSANVLATRDKIGHRLVKPTPAAGKRLIMRSHPRGPRSRPRQTTHRGIKVDLAGLEPAT